MKVRKYGHDIWCPWKAWRPSTGSLESSEKTCRHLRWSLKSDQVDKENGVKKHRNGFFFKKVKKTQWECSITELKVKLKFVTSGTVWNCEWQEGQLEEQEIKRKLQCKYSRIGLTQNITAEHANILEKWKYRSSNEKIGLENKGTFYIACDFLA